MKESTSAIYFFLRKKMLFRSIPRQLQHQHTRLQNYQIVPKNDPDLRTFVLKTTSTKITSTKSINSPRIIYSTSSASGLSSSIKSVVFNQSCIVVFIVAIVKVFVLSLYLTSPSFSACFLLFFSFFFCAKIENKVLSLSLFHLMLQSIQTHSFC